MDQKFTIERLIIHLVCSSRCPVNSGENAFWATGGFFAAVLERPLEKNGSKSEWQHWGAGLSADNASQPTAATVVTVSTVNLMATCDVSASQLWTTERHRS